MLDAAFYAFAFHSTATKEWIGNSMLAKSSGCIVSLVIVTFSASSLSSWSDLGAIWWRMTGPVTKVSEGVVAEEMLK